MQNSKLKSQNCNSKLKTAKNLKRAVEFHGHLGPYLVLGLLAGQVALKRLQCKKYFDIKVRVYGATEKPKSCLIDGLQLSTGATYGKGNIEKIDSPQIKIELYNRMNKKKVTLRLKDGLIQLLSVTKTHRDSELLAKELYRTRHAQLFDLTARS
jgi:formylmethanofuran dehydrogenase subunit E